MPRKSYRPIADYLPEEHVFRIIAPTPELHEMARRLPAARERKKEGCWVIPASPATAARISWLYKKAGLEVTSEFNRYQIRCFDAWRASCQALRTPLEELPSIPVTAVQPEGKWLHQKRAFWFAFPLEAALLDITMGGGKTKTAIDLMLNWQARDVLVISPLAAIEDAWEPHLTRHMTRSFSASFLYSGSVAKRTETAQQMRRTDRISAQSSHRIVLINHESFWREPFASWAISTPWDLVISDEIHREKGAGTLSSKFLHRIGMRAKRRLGLTGTLMPHSPLDVYGSYRFLDRGIFGTNHAKFLERYAEFGGYQGQEITGFRRLPELRRKVYNIAIHIDDSEQGLPETVDIKHSVKLEPEIRKAYNSLEKEFIAEIQSGTITAANSGVKLLRLHQIACGHVPVEDKRGKIASERIGHAKLNGLRDLFADFPKDEPIVIFTRFRPDIDDILDLCARSRRRAVEISGKRNDLSTWKFERADILVAQIQAVKEGVDLTRSSVGIFYSTGISLGDYLQCRKRLHRPPQKRMVRFIHILAANTRDVSTMRALEARHDVIATIHDEVRQ